MTSGVAERERRPERRGQDDREREARAKGESGREALLPRLGSAGDRVAALLRSIGLDQRAARSTKPVGNARSSPKFTARLNLNTRQIHPNPGVVTLTLA